jgi:hypothetical protein
VARGVLVVRLLEAPGDGPESSQADGDRLLGVGEAVPDGREDPHLNIPTTAVASIAAALEVRGG